MFDSVDSWLSGDCGTDSQQLKVPSSVFTNDAQSTDSWLSGDSGTAVSEKCQVLYPETKTSTAPT